MGSDVLKRLVDAACAVYRISDHLPSDDPIVRILKESALTTIASCVVFFYAPEEYNRKKAQSDIHTLCSYFFVARKQEWIDARNFDVLIAEYRVIKNELQNYETAHRYEKKENETVGREEKLRERADRNERTQLSPRQKKIFSYIKDERGAEEVSLKDLHAFSPSVAYRTIQRDVQVLLERGLIGRKGTTHNATYFLRR